MKTSLALVGFMGTGKTTVGRLLAQKLGKDFIEMDALIEQKAGRSIPEIFRQEGEAGFRQLEIEVTRKVAGKKNIVIACGGGIVLNTINIDRLRQECIIVGLTASPSVILKRTSADKDGRPLLAVADRLRQIKELMSFRRPFYERAADITVNTSRLKAEAVAGLIIEKLRGHESYRS
jgi:shikimate kinase